MTQDNLKVVGGRIYLNGRGDKVLTVGGIVLTADGKTRHYLVGSTKVAYTDDGTSMDLVDGKIVPSSPSSHLVSEYAASREEVNYQLNEVFRNNPDIIKAVQKYYNRI